ncbi:CMGC DYRK kinase [Fusarium circinatum]|uniref:CMGC DYRK kinase n=1 Tax=Fusarium circinatum TaxID=48490 RepID=A0A8H5TBZ3_FUSCI|nr:CMGC DYRK kinase [Fusarium circinatum]
MSQESLKLARELSTPANQVSSPPQTLKSNQASQSSIERPDLCFASIDTVHDGGIVLHSAWERKQAQTSPSDHLTVTQTLHKLLEHKPITSRTLADALFDNAERAGGRAYLPLDKLKALINSVSVRDLLTSLDLSPSTVETVVKDMFSHNLTSEAHRDRSGFSRIFAILVIINHAKEIEKFILNGVSDSFLPLTRIKEQTKNFRGDVHIHSAGRPDIDNRNLIACFSAFNSTDLTRFLIHQDMINIPFFSFPGDNSTVCFYDLPPGCVLPITPIGIPKRGGNGSVKKIELHAAHHNYSGARTESSNNEFAVKTLHIYNEERFRKEVEALERLLPRRPRRIPDHLDHLVHLELAYRHGNECCLVFPWASGNLKEYWALGKKSPKEHKDVIWFFKQCWGLAVGLRRLHDRTSYKIANKADNDIYTAEDLLAEAHSTDYGRHGDVKPENILWFPDYRGEQDHLAICDFGSTEFNSSHSKSHVNADAIYGYTTTYQAPDSLVQPEVSQKIDVWSLGCVFLEFVSWFLLGYHAAVDEFPKSRVMVLPDLADGIVSSDRFFNINSKHQSTREKSAMVKPAVVRWGMLVPDPFQRNDCRQVRTELDIIYNKCRNNSIYAIGAFKYKPPKPISKGADFLRLVRNFSTIQSQSKIEVETPQMALRGPSLVECRKEPGDEDMNQVSGPGNQILISAHQPDDFNNNTSGNGFELERYRTQPGEPKTPTLPIHSTNEIMRSSNVLSEVSTNDTTPLTTQPEEVALDSQESPAKHRQRVVRFDSYVEPVIEYGQPPARPRITNVAEQVDTPESGAGGSTLRDEMVSSSQCEPSKGSVLVPLSPITTEPAVWPKPTGHRNGDMRGLLRRAVDKLKPVNGGRFRALFYRRSKKSN